MNAWNKNRKRDAAALDEREWQAQEQALRDERLGLAASGSDAPDAHYRAVARALREPPAASLPPDFARQVAGLAKAQAPLARDATRFERTMLNLLGAALAMSGIVALTMYGGDVLAGMDMRIVRWGLPLAACVALTWSFDWARRFFDRDDYAHRA